MVGQSFDVAMLALIEAPSTADVTALMCSGDPLVCATALPIESARPSPMVSSVPARSAGLPMCGDVVVNKRQAKSTRGKRVISSSSQGDLWRICRDGMLVRTTASIKGRLRKAKEKIRLVCFRQIQNELALACQTRRNNCSVSTQTESR